MARVPPVREITPMGMEMGAMTQITAAITPHRASWRTWTRDAADIKHSSIVN